MSESGSPPAGAKSRRMSRTIASGLHTLSEHSCRPISGVRCLPAGVRDRSGHRCVHCRFVPGQSRVVFHQRRTVSRVGLLRLPRLQQRRRRVDAGHMDRRWIHIPRCHGDRIGDRCSSTARAGLVRVRRDPDCDRRRGDACLADQLHRGARDHRWSLARPHRDHTSCVGPQRTSDSSGSCTATSSTSCRRSSSDPRKPTT